MKAQILKIAGVKTDKEFYKLFPNTPEGEKAFMKKYGKEFKKAQTGSAISKAQNYGTFGPGNYDSSDIDNNGIPDLVQQAEGNPLMNNSSSTEEKKKPFNTPGAMNFLGGIKDAFDGIKAAEDKTKSLETWADVSNVKKRADISNAFVPKQPNQWYQPDALKNIHAANEQYNTVGRGTDVFNVQNGSMIGGNPTETQNMYSDGRTLYDNLEYEPFQESDDQSIKAYQNGSGGFGNMLGSGAGGDYSSFLGGSALGKGGLFGGDTGGGSWLAGAMGGDSSYANAASMIPGPVGMFATMAARMADPNPGKQRNAMNTINSNNAFSDRLVAGRNITGRLGNIGVGQNGQNLEMYEEGGYMNPEYNPQVITMFGDHTAEDFADYAHKYRAGGHLKEYTAPSDRAMQTYENGGEISSYAMGGKIQSHWGGNVEDESYNPYMPGSGITSIINGASHQNGGVGISYGNDSQNGYEQMAANGANMGAQIEAEDGESMIEMANGGEIDPQTGEQETNAVVIGNIPAKYDVLSLISDNQDLLGYLKKKGNDGRTMKSLFANLTKEEIAANKAKEKASKIANATDKTTWGKLDNATAQIIEDAGDTSLEQIANIKIGMAESQDRLHKIKEQISQSLGYNISAEDLGRGKITKDRDPITRDAPIGTAKSGAYLRKAQGGTTVATEEPALTEEEYNELVKLYDEGSSTSSGKSDAIKTFQRKYHQKFPQEALAAIQKTTKENGLSNEAKRLGLTKEDILAGKDVDKILQSNEDTFWGPRTKQYMASINSAYNNRPAAAPFQLNTLGAAPATEQTATDKKGIDVVPLKKNSALDAMGMISQLFQNRKFPSIDPRQFAGENVASSLNVQQPVPMQKPSVELDPIYRMNYNDVRNANTAGLRDVLRQNQGNPAANALALGRFAQQNQLIGGEEFRTNQAIEQQIYGGNRAKVAANQDKALALNANQANLQSVAKSKTDERNIEIAKSIADKEMKYTADKNKFLTASNLFPKYGYGANYQTQMQGPGYNPVIPQIYGGKASIQQVPVYKNGVLDHYEMIEGDGTTTNTTTLAPYQTLPINGNVTNQKNGGKVKKNYKNSSVVRAYKNL